MWRLRQRQDFDTGGLRAALGLALQSERLNEVRYRQGAVPVTFWLDAQEQRRQAELAQPFQSVPEPDANLAGIWWFTSVTRLSCYSGKFGNNRGDSDLHIPSVVDRPVTFQNNVDGQKERVCQLLLLP